MWILFKYQRKYQNTNTVATIYFNFHKWSELKEQQLKATLHCVCVTIEQQWAGQEQQLLSQHHRQQRKQRKQRPQRREATGAADTQGRQLWRRQLVCRRRRCDVLSFQLAAFPSNTTHRLTPPATTTITLSRRSLAVSDVKR